jgi:hypothetical protein
VWLKSNSSNEFVPKTEPPGYALRRREFRVRTLRVEDNRPVIDTERGVVDDRSRTGTPGSVGGAGMRLQRNIFVAPSWLGSLPSRRI